MSQDLALRKQLDAVFKSAAVSRYHTQNPTKSQTVGEHTYGVMWLVRVLTEGTCSREMLLAALAHDTPEFVTGDIPSPVKRKVDTSAIKLLEKQTMREANLLDYGEILTPEERAVLKLADNLEGFIWCSRELLRGNALISDTLDTYYSYLQHSPSHPVGSKIISITKENIYAARPTHKFSCE